MPGAVTSGSAGREESPAPAKVLLVEDDESVGVSLAGVLEMHGWRTTLVTSVALALAALREHVFDAVVSDLMLDDEHGRTGFAVLAEAARLQPGITRALITGYPTEAVITRAEAEGLAGVLVKPFAIPDLLDALAPALTEADAQQSAARRDESAASRS